MQPEHLACFQFFVTWKIVKTKQNKKNNTFIPKTTIIKASSKKYLTGHHKLQARLLMTISMINFLCLEVLYSTCGKNSNLGQMKCLESDGLKLSLTFQRRYLWWTAALFMPYILLWIVTSCSTSSFAPSVHGGPSDLTGTVCVQVGCQWKWQCAVPLPKVLQEGHHRPCQRHLWHWSLCCHW